MAVQRASEDDKRNTMVSVRYADGELERIRSEAERHGDSVSAFIRRASLRGEHSISFAIQMGTNNVPANPQNGATLTLHRGQPVINT
jgi:hypothetical protein